MREQQKMEFDMSCFMIYRNAKDIPTVINEKIWSHSQKCNYLRVHFQEGDEIMFKKDRIDYFSSTFHGETTVLFDRRKSDDFLDQDLTGYKVTSIWSGSDEDGHYIERMERTSWAD